MITYYNILILYSLFFLLDVCGSKYNNDPFDEVDKKPDEWAIMAAKIKAIEEFNIKNEKAKLEGYDLSKI